MRWTLRGLLLLLAPFAVYFAAVLLLTWIPVNRDFKQDPKGVPLYVTHNGVHADLWVPAKTEHFDWTAVIPPEHFAPGHKAYLLIGWGDRRFYLETKEWSDLRLGTALSGVFLPTETAMHVAYAYGPPVPDEELRTMRVSSEQYRRLIEHLRSGFVWGEDGKAILLDHPGYWPGEDRFYQGAGSYHLFRTCNSWINEGLKAAGVKTATWAPFVPCILYHLPTEQVEAP